MNAEEPHYSFNIPVSVPQVEQTIYDFINEYSRALTKYTSVNYY